MYQVKDLEPNMLLKEKQTPNSGKVQNWKAFTYFFLHIRKQDFEKLTTHFFYKAK